jgi:hypothetical protein
MLGRCEDLPAVWSGTRALLALRPAKRLRGSFGVRFDPLGFGTPAVVRCQLEVHRH